MKRRHALDRLAGAQHRADDVDAHHPLQPRRAHLIHTRLYVDNPGVVHQPVEPAEDAVDGLEHGNHIGFVADIALHGNRPAAVRFDFLHKC